MKKRLIVIRLSVVFLAAIISIFLLIFKSAMHVMQNADYVAGVDYAIGSFLHTQDGLNTNIFISYVKCNYKDIQIKDGVILDKNNRPMKIIIINTNNVFYTKVSSAGKDGQWDTKDDLIREGYWEK